MPQIYHLPFLLMLILYPCVLRALTADYGSDERTEVVICTVSFHVQAVWRPFYNAQDTVSFLSLSLGLRCGAQDAKTVVVVFFWTCLCFD